MCWMSTMKLILFIGVLALIGRVAVKANQGCVDRPSDIFFALDSSTSVAREDFEKQRRFVLDVVSDFNIGPNQTRVGLTIFSTTAQSVFELDTYKTKEEVLTAIKKIEQVHGGTRTDAALSYVRETGLAPGRVRPGATRVLIVLTDGMSRYARKTKEEAEKVHESGILVFVLGIGYGVDRDELTVIASKPTSHYVYEVTSFDALPTIKGELSSKTCRARATEVIDPEKLQAACESKPSDIMFVLDSSSSIMHPDYQKERDFVLDMVDIFSVGPNKTRIGLIQFSDDVSSAFSFSEFSDKEAVLAAISKIGQLGGGTETDKALAYLRKTSFASSRDGVPKIAIVLTDGLSRYQDKTIQQATLAQASGISVFVIGIGMGVDEEELKAIAIVPENALYVDSFDFLSVIKNEFALKTCTAAPVTGQEMMTKACGGKPADIVFLVDSSSSVALEDFDKQRQFVQSVVQIFDVGGENTRVGLVLFSDEVRPMISLADGHGKNSLLKKIGEIGQIGGGTRTDLALAFVRDSSFAEARDNVPKIAIVITDGMSLEATLTSAEAERMRSRGITVFVIGIGHATDETELKSIASDPKDEHVFKLQNFDFLDTIKGELAMKTCKVSGDEQMLNDQAADEPFSCTSDGPVDLLFSLNPAVHGMERSSIIYRFISGIVSQINIGDDGFRVGVATPRCTQMIDFRLNSRKEKFEVLRELQMSQTAYVHDLLKAVRKKFSVRLGARPNAKKVVVLFTSSAAKDKAGLSDELQRLRYSEYSKIIIVPIGAVDKQLLLPLATEPDADNYLPVKDIESLSGIKLKITHALCT